MIPVGWLDPSQDCWDSNMLRRLLDGDLYAHDLKFKHHKGYPNADSPVVLAVPGRYYAQHTDQISEAIQRFVSVLMVVTSDEEGLFDPTKVEHPQLKWWIQTPRTGRTYPAGSRFIGVGFPPHFNDLPQQPPDKAVDVVLSAQDTHERRHQAFAALDAARQDTWQVVPTEGFTKGLPAWAYTRDMVSSKVAPAPSGAVSPDSFRFWEALEAHAIPIADDVSPVDGPTGYWNRLFPDAPFPILTDYNDLPGYIGDALRDWPANANRIAAYWMQHKRRMSHWLREDLEQLGAP